MKRLIWLLLLVSTIGCTTSKAIPSVDTSKQDLEFEMALQESLKNSHQEEMTAIQAQADILTRIETSVASLDAKIEASGTPLGTSEEENGTNPAETPSSTPSDAVEPLNEGSKTPESTTSTESLPEKNTDDYVVMFTAPWCGACTADKNVMVPSLIESGVKTYYVNVDNPRNRYWKDQVRSLPTYWVVDGSTGFSALHLATVRSRYEGRMEAKVLREAARKIRKGKAVQAVTFGSCSPQCTCGCNSGGVCSCNRQTQTYSQPMRSVQYGNRMYSGRVCNNPNCRMCNQIESALNYQPMSIPLAPTPPTIEPAVNPSQEPTPTVTLNRMIDLLKLNETDVLADLGCGDGRVLIQAVNRYGCKAIGVEIDPVKADEARKKVYDAGLDSRIEIITGDALDFDPVEHGVTALTTYLYPELLAKLKSKFDSVRIGASPFHQVPGLTMTKTDDVWIYQPSI